MIRLALDFLRYDKAKTIGALFGVIISIFLIGQQAGIFIFLTNAMTALADNTKTDMWVVDESTTNVSALGKLDVRLLREVASIEGVKRTYPYVIAPGSAKFANGKTAGLNLIGSEAPAFRGGPWNLNTGTREDLLSDGAITTDFYDSKTLGDSKFGDWLEVGGQQVHIAAQTKGARGFGLVYSFTTIERARALGNFPTDKVSAILMDLEPGADPVKVRDRINSTIPGVKAWLPKDFSKATLVTVLFSTGIAISIGTLVIFAIISGTVIIGLTLYSSAIDRLKDYGIMKAIGATNGYITRMIFLQAFLIGIVGFGVAMVFLELFRNGIANAGTLFNYSLPLRAAFLGLTLTISLSGGFFAARRISKLEPAAIFRM
jgi:putative ABC transport system permease protein